MLKAFLSRTVASGNAAPGGRFSEGVFILSLRSIVSGGVAKFARRRRLLVGVIVLAAVSVPLGVTNSVRTSLFFKAAPAGATGVDTIQYV